MKPRLLFHCHHSLGLGHLVRSLVLTRALAPAFDVMLLVGGELPREVELPADVEVVQLQALAGATAQRTRAGVVLDAFRRHRPDVVVVELFPFGRKKLAGELVPVLVEARERGAVVACSLRDILVRGRDDQAEHDERASRRATTLFDAILVHADPRLVRLEETFRPRTALRIPVRYTGFVAPSPIVPVARTGPLVVSAGGGRFGAPLLRAALDAAPDVSERTGLPVRLVAGPFLPAAERSRLEQATRGRCDVELIPAVADLARELASARASLSQCGYNTALDLIRARVPALVVPFAAPGEDEQARRAALLARLGVARVLGPQDLGPASLAEAVRQVATTTPPRAELDLHGAANTVSVLSELLATRRRGAAA